IRSLGTRPAAGDCVIAFFQTFFRELVAIFLDASPYILFGFAIAALLNVLLPVHTVQRLLGRGRVRPIFMASLLGIPLPLCSCAVLPTAIALRRRGASPGATASFLISTPESDVDAIVLTYGLMGPLMAIYRPIAGFVTAIAAGFAADFWAKSPIEPEAGTAHDAHDKLSAEEARTKAATSWNERVRAGFSGAFRELFDETSHWILAGLIISALISTILPASIVTRYLSQGAVPLLLMLLIGIPLYICASASTPIAAALMLKGLSPGAALVFLLAGPATNIGSIGILTRTLGKRFVAIYVGSIAIFSLLFGILLDMLAKQAGWDPKVTLGQASNLPAWIAWPSVVVLLALFFFSFRRAAPPKEFRRMGQGLEWIVGARITARRLAIVALIAAGLVFLSTCFLIVPPGKQGLVTRFGAPVGHGRSEGLHLKLPFPLERAEIVHSAAVRRIESGFRTPPPGSDGKRLAPDNSSGAYDEEALFLTGDENLVDTKAAVQYRVFDPARYRYGFVDPDATIQAQAIAELLEVLAGRNIDGFYTDRRQEIEKTVEEGIRRRTSELDLGIEIVHFGILSVHAPAEVHAAFRDVASSQEDKQREIDIAYRYSDQTVNLARGEAAARVSQAQGFSSSAVLRAEGDSQSLRERIAAYRQRPKGTKDRLYLETVEQVLSRGRKIIQPGWKGSGSVDLWISGKAGAPVAVDNVLPQEEGVPGIAPQNNPGQEREED
ncbi:MAG TPA: SO_0444 family Cu/Zn efflux transporter, partial [bacterium]|nr:SO_0444 family Cu/Zn efflux transporter [bacterium]